ncbi:heme o synthase [Aureivirga sp. CE67]|uniref:heme o synthase n=1 Tax=Aureivirga sp. CE67 TaxID=1788983 RepID=UPI0018C9C0D9|nr:heme o synthase [Aureivirga sp. CE67]
MQTTSSTIEKKVSLVRIINDFKEITKMRLSVSVVFSSIIGYLLGAENIQISVLILLAIGGYLAVGASNTFNQIIEKDVDAQMKRTKNRPLPAGRMTVNTALVIGIICTILGIYILYTINPRTALFGAISIFIYVSVYTPLKAITPLTVWVGAIPGAIPFMLGWVAATNEFSIEPGTLFLIQFFWQFPHFWAIGWLAHDEYKKVGYNMLPMGKKDERAVIQIILYTICMIVFSVMPAFGVTGRLHLSTVSGVLVFLLGLMMLFYAVKLYREKTDKVARQLMFSSLIYITLIQIIFVVDKFLH